MIDPQTPDHISTIPTLSWENTSERVQRISARLAIVTSNEKRWYIINEEIEALKQEICKKLGELTQSATYDDIVKTVLNTK